MWRLQNINSTFEIHDCLQRVRRVFQILTRSLMFACINDARLRYKRAKLKCEFIKISAIQSLLYRLKKLLALKLRG